MIELNFKKGREKMISLEENLKELQEISTKLEDLGESL